MITVGKTPYALVLPAFSLMTAGCAMYHSMPMDPVAVDTALTGPDWETVRKQASTFSHPAIQSLTFDDRDGLSPEELAVMAVLTNPQLKAERDRCGVANAQLLQAGLLPNPQLTTALDIPNGNGSMEGLYTGGLVDLSWDITSLITHPSERRAARAEYESVRLDVAWQEWQAAQAARLHAYRLLNLREQLTLARELEADGQQRLAFAKQANAQRQITVVELSAMEDIALLAQNNRRAIEQTLNTEESDLKLAVGVSPETRLPLQPAAIHLENAPFGSELAKAWTTEIESQRLDLLALKQGYDSQEENVRTAIRSQFPAININGNRTRDTGDVKSVGIGLSIDLPLFDRGQGRIAMERATRKQLFDDYTARVAEARAQVAQMGMQMDSVLNQWKAGHENAGKLEQRAANAKKAYDEGRINAANYFDLRDQWINRRLDELALQNEWINLRLALALAAGRPITPNLEL